MNLHNNYEMEKILLTSICRPKQWKTISTKDLKESGFPVYGANGKIGFFDKYTHEFPTLLITCRGATCGNINISEPKSYVNGNAMALDELSPNFDIFFLKHYLEFRKFNDVISGSAQPQITGQGLSKIKIPLIPLQEQKRIATLLDTADSLRQKDKALLQKYDALAQSLFLELFGDPVRNEKGWEKKKLSAVGKLDRGKSKHRPRNAPELLNGPYPLIQTGDVANAKSYIKEYKSTYSEIGLKQSKLWPKGTLCITIAANIAKTGILTFDACFPDSVVGFIPNEQTNTDFVQHWISFLQKMLEDSAPESAQKNINLAILKELEIICPPIELQNQFAEQIQLIEKQKELVMENLKKSEELFMGLLGESFN